MRLQIIISRFSNLLFFIQKTGKYNLSDENLELLFYEKTEDKILKQIKKSVGDKNTKQLQKIIAVSEPEFTSYWKKAFTQLILWEKYFQDNKLLFQQVISNIKKLSGVKYYNISKIPIYLVSDHLHRDKEVHAWFSWAPNKSFVVIEIPADFKTPKNLFPISVLAHEFFHLILKKNKKLSSVINKAVQKNEGLLKKLSGKMPNKMFLEDLLISSFIPEGYLGQKSFKTKITAFNVKPKNFLEWRKLVAHKMSQTAKKYINETRQIDNTYIEYLLKVIKQKTE